jgi:hypothetical protein
MPRSVAAACRATGDCVATPRRWHDIRGPSPRWRELGDGLVLSHAGLPLEPIVRDPSTAAIALAGLGAKNGPADALFFDPPASAGRTGRHCRCRGRAEQSHAMPSSCG